MRARDSGPGQCRIAAYRLGIGRSSTECIGVFEGCRVVEARLDRPASIPYTSEGLPSERACCYVR